MLYRLALITILLLCNQKYIKSQEFKRFGIEDLDYITHNTQELAKDSLYKNYIYNQKDLFEYIHPDSSNVQFSNTIINNIQYNWQNYIFNVIGGGLSVGDINNDGLKDLFFCSIMNENKLYLNKGNLKFQDITLESGIVSKSSISHGAIIHDFNGDQLQDIYICNGGNFQKEERKNQLFINQGDNTFIEDAKSFGLDNDGFSMQAYLFDYDKDDDLDIYLVGYPGSRKKNMTLEMFTSIDLEQGIGESDILYRNNGNNTYTNVSEEMNINDSAFGHSALIADFDEDSNLEIVVCNDFSPDDIYYKLKNGRYIDLNESTIKSNSTYSMGSDYSDVNNDGWLDFMTVDLDMENVNERKTTFTSLDPAYNKISKLQNAGYHIQFPRNHLHINNTNGTFTDVANQKNIATTNWTWSVLFNDFDLDGYKDIYTSNGFIHDVSSEDKKLFRLARVAIRGNDNQKYIELAKQMSNNPKVFINKIYQNSDSFSFNKPVNNWGLNLKSISTGASLVDLDNDGDMDIVISNFNQEAFILKNHSDRLYKDESIIIQLQYKYDNPFGINSSIKLLNNEKEFLQRAEVNLNKGYLSTSDTRITFGLRSYKEQDYYIEIKWPNNKITLHPISRFDKKIRIEYKEEDVLAKEFIEIKTSLKKFSEESLSENISHSENEYLDFKRNSLLHFGRSNLGPGLAIKDLNNDGVDEFFLTGNSEKSSYIYDIVNEQKISIPTENEHLGVLLINSKNNNTGYIIEGGNEQKIRSKPYKQNIIEIKNDLAVKIKETFPLNNGSCLSTCDFDQDGKLDFFVGGGDIPNQYPHQYTSKIISLSNDNQYYVKDSFLFNGVVNSSLWTDFDNDGDKDLIIVAEWSPILFYENIDGKLTYKKQNEDISINKGWWHGIAGGDFDNDGDIDYIIGNSGTNNYYNATHDSPIAIYYDDFNNDNKNDLIFSKNGMPIHAFESYRRYFRKSVFQDQKSPGYINKLNTSETLRLLGNPSPDSLFVNCLSSIMIINDGKGGFTIKQLPQELQYSRVYGIAIGDFNHDGNIDILTHGNQTNAHPVFQFINNGRGLLLLGDGKNNFKPQSFENSGFISEGDGRALGILNGLDNKKYVISTSNNDNVKFFKIENSEQFKDYINFDDFESHAIVYKKNKSVTKIENYIGGGYLTQKFQYLPITEDIIKVDIYSGEILSRTIKN